MIIADEARKLKAKGISQEEAFREALDRTEAAILDSSRKGLDWVNVSVAGLQEKSFAELTKDLQSRGFRVHDPVVVNQNMRALKISWEDSKG